MCVYLFYIFIYGTKFWATNVNRNFAKNYWLEVTGRNPSRLTSRPHGNNHGSAIKFTSIFCIVGQAYQGQHVLNCFKSNVLNLEKYWQIIASKLTEKWFGSSFSWKDAKLRVKKKYKHTITSNLATSEKIPNCIFIVNNNISKKQISSNLIHLKYQSNSINFFRNEI